MFTTREYTIVRRPEKLDWSGIPALQIDQLMHTDPLPISAQAQLCYDETALYVHLSAVEENIRAENFGLLDQVCDDSCLEFFFSPIAGDLRYFNIECNLNGCIFLGMGSSIHNLVRFIQEEPRILPRAQRTSEGWEVTYSIPYSFIRQFFPDFSPAPGYSMRANCYKCGDMTVQPHYLCWNPVPYQPCAFHNPSEFGIMHFA